MLRHVYLLPQQWWGARVGQMAVRWTLQPMFEPDKNHDFWVSTDTNGVRGIHIGHRALCTGETQEVDAEVWQDVETNRPAALRQILALPDPATGNGSSC